MAATKQCTTTAPRMRASTPLSREQIMAKDMTNHIETGYAIPGGKHWLSLIDPDIRKGTILTTPNPFLQ